MTDNHKDLNDFTLAPNASGTPKRRKSPVALVDQTATVRLEAAYMQSFEKAWGFPITKFGKRMYVPARDRKLLKDLVADVGEDMALSLVNDFFFTHRHDRYIRSRTPSGTVRNFISCVERLLILRNGHAPLTDDRTAQNNSEIERAKGPRK